MADYYTRFSFIMELPQQARDQAFALFQRLMQAMGTTSDLDDPVHPVKDEITAKAVELANAIEGWLGFSAEVVANGLWLRNDGDSGNPEHVGLFVQTVLQMAQLDILVVFSWADTCNKPRTDGFGGGATAISRHGVEAINTYRWCDEQNRSNDPKLGPHAGAIKSYLMFQGNRCPVCDSEDLVGGNAEMGSGGASHESSCVNCQSTWLDVYALTGFEKLKLGPCSLCGQPVFDHGKTVFKGSLFCSPSCVEEAQAMGEAGQSETTEVSHGVSLHQ